MKKVHDLYIVCVFVDKCEDLAGGEADTASLYPKCNIKLIGSPTDDKFNTDTKTKTENPVFEDSFMFTSKQPQNDKLLFEVINVNDSDTLLGTVTIPLDYLMTSLDQEFMDKLWPLEGGNPNAKMYLSAKLFVA